MSVLDPGNFKGGVPWPPCPAPSYLGAAFTSGLFTRGMTFILCNCVSLLSGAEELGEQGVHLRTQYLSHDQGKCRFCAPDIRLLLPPLLVIMKEEK